MQQRSEETKTKILSAAFELFSREGYDATGVAEICQAAGVSKGAFYHHFPSKQAVFLELLERWVDSLGKQIRLPRAVDVPHSLLESSKLMEGVINDASGKLPVFLEFWRQAIRKQVIWRATIEPYHLFQDAFAEIVQKGIDEGTFRQVDPRTAGLALVALAVGILLQAALEPEAADWGKTSTESVRLLLEGLQRRDG